MTPGAAILAGLCATLLGVGLQRFAYAPLLPAMVQAGWLTAGAAGGLAAVNFAGYLAGAGLAPCVGRALSMRLALRLAMLVATFCFAACAWRGGLWWFLPWRLLAGIAGGILMVLAGPAVQSVVPAGRRGLAAGIMFAGPGGGLSIGATLVPALLPQGVAPVWLALAALALVLTVLSWTRWPDVPAPAPDHSVRLRGETLLLVLAYTLAGIAATPHMGWWPDFVARGVGLGIGAGAAFWLLYGLGALIGPGLFGRLGDRIGTAAAFRVTMVLQVVALALPLLSWDPAALAASAVLGGATAVGLTGLTLTRAREVAGTAAPAVWRIGTVGWASAQAGSGAVLARVYVASGWHGAIFAVGLAAALAAALMTLRRSGP